MKQGVPQLLTWPISGNLTHQRAFLQRLQTSCLPHGDKTNSNYGSSARWASWCQQQGRNPLSGPVADVVNFLAELFSQGYQYQSLNFYCSAISSVHEKVDGNSIGVHPAVTKLLKGAFHTRPLQPRLVPSGMWAW